MAQESLGKNRKIEADLMKEYGPEKAEKVLGPVLGKIHRAHVKEKKELALA
jgi:hypothetical protein